MSFCFKPVYNVLNIWIDCGQKHVFFNPGFRSRFQDPARTDTSARFLQFLVAMGRGIIIKLRKWTPTIWITRTDRQRRVTSSCMQYARMLTTFWRHQFWGNCVIMSKWSPSFQWWRWAKTRLFWHWTMECNQTQSKEKAHSSYLILGKRWDFTLGGSLSWVRKWNSICVSPKMKFN